MMHIQSPRTDDQAIEQMIKDKGADKAPRITPDDIEANIAREVYFTAEDGHIGAYSWETGRVMGRATRKGPLDLLTFCVLVLRNGFTVTGESACASPENFNSEIGRRIARQNAVEKLWPLMGYELKCRLAAEPKDYRDRVRAECAELNGKIERLMAFGKTEQFSKLPAAEQDRLHAQLYSMGDYRNVLRERIAAFDQEATA